MTVEDIAISTVVFFLMLAFVFHKADNGRIADAILFLVFFVLACVCTLIAGLVLIPR